MGQLAGKIPQTFGSNAVETHVDGLPDQKIGFQNRPGRTRTCDPLLRRQMLYPPELRAQIVKHAMQEFNIAITDNELWDYMRFNSEERSEPEANTPALPDGEVTDTKIDFSVKNSCRLFFINNHSKTILPL